MISLPGPLPLGRFVCHDTTVVIYAVYLQVCEQRPWRGRRRKAAFHPRLLLELDCGGLVHVHGDEARSVVIRPVRRRPAKGQGLLAEASRALFPNLVRCDYKYR